MRMATMKKSRLFLLLPVLLLAACVTPGVEAPQQSPVTVDSSGRVMRLRADRNQDDSIGRNIASQLRQSEAALFKGVSVLAWDRVVLLTGAVAKPEHRRRVEQIAKATDGVDVVFNDVIVAEIPDVTVFVPEVWHEQRIYAGLLGQTDIAGAYVVRMVNGVVTLMGTARDAEDVAKAVAFAREAEGVKWVVNHVTVK